MIGELMSDHALAILGLVVGIGGIVAGIVTAYYFYLKAQLRIDPRVMIRHEPLVDSASKAMTDVSVSFKGDKIENLNRCILVLYNTGNQAIPNEAIAKNDLLRVHFPEGALALGVGVLSVTRDAIGLSARIADDASDVLIDFAFLDANDGGVVEILYQGNSKESPTVIGSIIGAPGGIKGAPADLEFNIGGEDKDEYEGSRRSGEISFGATIGTWARLTFGLCVLAAISGVIIGPASVLSIIFYTLITVVQVLALLYKGAMIRFRHTIGSTGFWRATTASARGKRQTRNAQVHAAAKPREHLPPTANGLVNHHD